MTILDEIRADAEAIERALHEGLVANLGLRSDSEVIAAIALVVREARYAPGGLGALLCGDYDDNPVAFPARMRGALWRSAQMHGAEDQYPALTAVAGIDANRGLSHA